MATLEILKAHPLSKSMAPMINGIHQAAVADGHAVTVNTQFHGGSDWLVMAGLGAKPHNAARRAQIAAGGRVLHWDHGYFDRAKVTGKMRMGIDSDHPQAWLSRTPSDSARWDAAGIKLREDYKPEGHILLVGLGTKSRDYLNEHRWEENTYRALQARFPKREIVFRPKGKDKKKLPCRVDAVSSIESLLVGASLVVCRHSNVAVDAIIAGVPFEAVDGAAKWLADKPYTVDNRLDFLRRISYWQWRADEAADAWQFIKRIAS